MTIVHKTIELTDQQDHWIKSQITRGQYADDSECIRDLIRREQERVQQLEQLRTALINGENSGEPVPFDVVAFNEKMRVAHGFTTEWT